MISNSDIEAAYLGPKSKAALALGWGISEKTIERRWTVAKSEGRLPEHRPHFLAASGVEKHDDAEVDYENMSDEDFERHEAEEAARNESRRAAGKAGCDALLAALVREHGSPAKLAPDLREAVPYRKLMQGERRALVFGLPDSVLA